MLYSISVLRTKYRQQSHTILLQAIVIIVLLCCKHLSFHVCMCERFMCVYAYLNVFGYTWGVFIYVYMYMQNYNIDTWNLP